MKEFELKYKSALGTATTIYAYAKESNDKKIIQSLELIFPELKKTKDELIKEELIHFLETCRDPRFVGNRKQDEWLEWLEKQREHKFKIGDTIHCGDSTQPVTITGLSTDSYQTDSVYSHIPFSEEDKWELVTSWSEEDENIFACLIGTLTWTTNNNYHCSEDIPKYMRWLENLKQRLNGTE